MKICDLDGNSRDVKEKVIHIAEEVSIIITKWAPDGTKSTKFFCAFETTTGHCIPCPEKTRDLVIQTVKKNIHIIKRKIPKSVNIGGLFG